MTELGSVTACSRSEPEWPGDTGRGVLGRHLGTGEVPLRAEGPGPRGPLRSELQPRAQQAHHLFWPQTPETRVRNKKGWSLP